MLDYNIVIRFKGYVPSWILFIHVFLMFFACFFAIMAGLLVIFYQLKFKTYSWITLLLIIGWIDNVEIANQQIYKSKISNLKCTKQHKYITINIVVLLLN